jgi:hypothetical protein
MKLIVASARSFLGPSPPASIARITGGVLSWSVIASQAVGSSAELDVVMRDSLTATMWLIGAFVGVNLPTLISLQKFGLRRPWEWRPTWTGSVWTALFFGALTAGVVVPVRAWPQTLLAFALATNIAYVGAKVGCAQIGCCKSNRPGRLGTTINRFGLPASEACFSIIATLVVAAMPYSASAAAVLGFSLHAVVRGVAGWLRFKNRTALSFVTDSGVGWLATLTAIVGTIIGTVE